MNKIEVGTPCTEVLYTDRHAYEVIEVVDERHIVVRQMEAHLIGDFLDQEYELNSNPNGNIARLFYTKNHGWRERIGRKLGCNSWLIGIAREYYDPSF